jgi:monoamine oxidase
VIELVAELGVRTHDQHVTGDAMYDAPEGAIRIDGNPIDVPAFRFTDGADSLTEAMTAALPAGTVRLSLPVHLVDAASSDLVVHAGSSVVECRTAVLALAPAAGIVQIGFRPPLPDSIAALARATPVWMGTTTKVVAIYDEPFWRAEGLSGSAISHLGPLREIHDMAGPDGTPAALFGFAPSGGTIEHAAVVEQLTRLFGPEAAEPTELHVMDWAQDLSLAGEEPSTAFELFGHPVHRQPLFDGRLVWASTETATDSPGHVEGALEAAEHAAREVLATLEHTPIPTGGEST